MKSLILQFSAARRQFSFPALVETAGTIEPVPAEMLVDSGSNRTGLSEAVVEKLGVDINQLLTAPTGGITGLGDRPRLAKLRIWIMAGDGGFVDLEEVMVLTEVVRKGRRGKGGWTERKEVRWEPPCLFGMDAVTKLGARIFMDPLQGRGRLEWD